MVDAIPFVGKHAGRIWETLHKDGALPETRLLKKTKLNQKDFYTAIGWLARENKIFVDGKTYTLGETNLTPKIGKDAGMVWKVLDTWGEVDVPSLVRLARIEEKDVFSAVGWLAREGKIDGDKKSTKDKTLKFWLR